MKSLFLFLFGLDLLLSPVFSLCPLPPMVANAVGNTGYDKLNGYYIEYSCNLGYYIGYGDSRLKCSNGTINGNLPTCMRKRCQSLSPGPRVYISSNTTEYGSVVWVKCEKGYKMSSTNSVKLKLTCIDGGPKTGQWSSSMPDCLLITCSKCITLNYGKSNCNSSRTYNYNSTVEYWCDSGFISYGNNSLRCGDNGSWVTDKDTFRMTCNASKTYIGCYGMENVTSTSTNIDNCRLDCQRNGYHYAGFSNAGCACGNSLTNLAPDQCQERCNINGTVTCGGTGNIRTAHYSFYGCYTDSTVPTITIKLPADSTKNCIEYCRLQNKRYALLLSFDKCSCQDLVSITATPVDAKRCQFRNVTDVYFVRIIDLEKFYASCQDLYKAGVDYHGDFVLGKNRILTRCNFKDGTLCDHQWIGYKGACYHFNTDNRTFQESLSYCASLNSDLASIHDRDEVDFLKQTITEFQDLKQQPNWYIGLYDSFQSSNYLWSDGTLKVFNDFIQERPSRDFWPCVHLIEKGWTDAPCWIPVGVICKKKQDANQCLSLTNPTSGRKYITQDPDMNPGLCFQICRGLKLPISAVNTVTCHCYLTMPQHSVLNWTECSKYCISNNHQNCGGGQNIFFVTKESGQPKALSCNELQLQGMANPFTQDSAGVPLCPGNSTNSCAHTWIASHNSCYKFFESHVLYKDAVKQCIKNNAYIVSINDATEESRLLAITQKIQVFQNIFEWWIGLTNVQHLGVFRWSDGQPVSYNKITNMEHNDITWIPRKNMWSTSSNYHAFICEKNSAFRGCYKGISQASVITSTVDMTVNMCVELCRGRIKNYALLEEYRCYCSDNVSTQATCDTKATCKAQPNQFCGKYPVFAAYQVDQFKKFANNCQDLLFEGITAPTVYVLEDKRKNCDFRGNVSICPSDTRTWIGFDGQCYLLVNETKSWVEAQNYCLSIGSTLASISDEQHLEFLIKSIKPRYSLTYYATVWLGGSDDIYEGFYSWVDGNLLSKNQSKAIGTGEQYHLALVKPSYQLTKTKTTLGYILCQITKDYRGCFQTPASSSPNITILVTTDNLVSVNLCKQLCLGRNFNYSLTNQKSCACTNNHTSLTLVDDKKCQNPCPSQNLLLCGSQDTWALHLLDNSRLATHCSQLAINGIFLNATYKLWNSTKGSSEFKQCGQADNSSCPIGWVGKDGVCYDFSTKKTKLSEARKICFSKSAILSFPVNAVARKFIVDMVNAVPTIWPLGKFFVGVQTFNHGSYVAATGKIIKSDKDIPTSFNQLTLTWSNSYSTPSSTSLEYFICEKFSGYKGCASLSNQQQSVSLTTLAMTATQCLEFCRGQEFSLAAVNTTSCFCLKADEVLSWQPKSSIDWCFQSCPGFDNQPCGGKNVFSVYEADPNASLPDSCDELVNLGVTAKSTYKLQPNNRTSILKTTCFSTGGYAEGIQPNNHTFTSKQASFSTTDLRVHIFPTMSNAWKPTSVNGQWVEVALPSLYVVTGIRTRGVMKPNERWVMSYELFYGDASPGYLAPYSENNITEANTDGNSVVTRLFRKPFVANTIRLVVKQSHISIALGFEFLGQPYEHVFASNKSIGCFAGDNSTGNVLATATTKDDCKKTCLANGYPIYGIQEKKGTFVCKCVLSFGKYGQLNDTECLSDSSVSPFILYRTFEMACQSPDLVNWAKIIPLSNPVQGKYAYNMKVMYTCILGYEFPDKSNSSIVKCLENNQWESLPGNCSRKHCLAIPKVNHTTTDTNDTFFGSKVTYQCQPGFMFTNYQVSFTIECLAYGTWNTTVPSCVGIKCKDPSPPANSRLTARNNTHATFICNKGFYFLDGFTEKTFICQQNVTWAFNNEECQAPDPFHRQNAVTQGEKNKRIATPSYSLHVRSLLDCISKCMQHMTCSILSLHTQSSNEGANCDLFLGTRPQIILTDAPGWNMYYMRLIR